jgi:environmental stress-induced protein Ves
MLLLPFHASKTMPWKNGGGVTTEIAISPAAATLSEFDWRVSIARIETTGPFSAFPGIDRTLAVLSGAGLTLNVDGRAPLQLLAGNGGVALSGELWAHARVSSGVVEVFNVMTQRSRCNHSFQRVDVVGAGRIRHQGNQMLVLMISGTHARVFGTAGQAIALRAYDSVLSNTDEDIDFDVTADGVARFCVVHLSWHQS